MNALSEPSSAPLDMLAPCSAKFLLNVVALRHGVCVKDLLGPTKPARIAAARMQAYVLIYQHTQMSFAQMGVMFNRSHSSLVKNLHRLGVRQKLVELRVPHATRKGLETSRACDIPTNGHPTQTAAIIELHEQRVQPKVIADRLGVARNSVNRAINIYRQRTGNYIEPVVEKPRSKRILPPDIESMERFKWRNYYKSIEGARKALEAAAQ